MRALRFGCCCLGSRKLPLRLRLQQKATNDNNLLHPRAETPSTTKVSPLSQATITLPCALARATAVTDSIRLDLACRVLETRLLQRLRFAGGKVYAVAASPFFGSEAPGRGGGPGGALRGEVAIGFSCAPGDREALVEAALGVVAALQAEGPTAEEVETVR